MRENFNKKNSLNIYDIVFKHVGMRKFDKSLFVPVQNDFKRINPYKLSDGGYWASPEDVENNWEETFIQDDISKQHYCRFKFLKYSKILIISEKDDLLLFPYININDVKSVDYEKLANYYDAIYYCPKKEEILTLLPNWDCICVFVLNVRVMDIIENI